ncbi:MAG: hypothetical protein ACFFCS_02335 [Candidatus Hodarchaeota archaeon]
MVPHSWSFVEVENFSDKMKEIDGYVHVTRACTDKVEMIECRDITFNELRDLLKEHAAKISDKQDNDKNWRRSHEKRVPLSIVNK